MRKENTKQQTNEQTLNSFSWHFFCWWFTCFSFYGVAKDTCLCISTQTHTLHAKRPAIWISFLIYNITLSVWLVSVLLVIFTVFIFVLVLFFIFQTKSQHYNYQPTTNCTFPLSTVVVIASCFSSAFGEWK